MCVYTHPIQVLCEHGHIIWPVSSTHTTKLENVLATDPPNWISHDVVAQEKARNIRRRRSRSPTKVENDAVQSHGIVDVRVGVGLEHEHEQPICSRRLDDVVP